eukprot:GSChrysophyteH1.ASY1.ANO1.176.1 assembled CDS
MPPSSISISAGVGLSYIGLYTGYNKASKRLEIQNLRDFFCVGRGWDWTLVEANKALSLTGLTTMMDRKSTRREFETGALVPVDEHALGAQRVLCVQVLRFILEEPYE